MSPDEYLDYLNDYLHLVENNPEFPNNIYYIEGKNLLSNSKKNWNFNIKGNTKFYDEIEPFDNVILFTNYDDFLNAFKQLFSEGKLIKFGDTIKSNHKKAFNRLDFTLEDFRQYIPDYNKYKENNKLIYELEKKRKTRKVLIEIDKLRREIKDVVNFLYFYNELFKKHRLHKSWLHEVFYRY